MLGLWTLLLCLGALQHQVLALQVTPGSPCSAVCLNDPESNIQDPASSNTDVSEIDCLDDEFSTDPVGIKFQNCQECLQKSNATRDGESDSKWFLYNSRYAVDVCIYGFKNESQRVSSPCDVGGACKSLRTALLVGNLDSTRDTYEYCTANGSAFGGDKLDSCIHCYASNDDTRYLSNFLIALKAGCQQKPQNGQLLGLSKTVFTSTPIEITDPPANTDPGSSDGSATGMTTGAIVGIAVGGALLFLGGIGLFFVYHRKQKRLYDSDLNGYDSGSNSGRGMKSRSPQPLLLAPGGISRSSSSTPDHQMKVASIYAERSLGSRTEYELRAQDSYSHLRSSSQAGRETPPRSHRTKSSATSQQIRGSIPLYLDHEPEQHPDVPAYPAYIPATHSRQSSRGEPITRPVPEAMVTRARTRMDSVETAQHSTSQAAQQQLQQHQQSGPTYQPSRWPSPDRNPFRSSMNSNRPAPSAPVGAAVNPTNPFIAKIIAGTTSVSQPSQPPSVASTLQTLLPGGIPPPPPGSKAPSLAMPSVPRIKVPATYVPPTITVQDATPVERN